MKLEQSWITCCSAHAPGIHQLHPGSGRDSRKTQLDPHFKPQWASCPHCLIDFDVIGATETYKEDTDFILNRLGLKVLIHYMKL